MSRLLDGSRNRAYFGSVFAFGPLARRLVCCTVVAAFLTLGLASSALAAPAHLLIRTDAVPGGALLPFDTDNPTAANLGAAVTITGTGGERVLGIDSRPGEGVLYGITEASRLYKINPATGSATQVGAPGATTLDPFVGVFQGVGFDFNPVAGLLRVTEDDGTVNGQDDNFSVDPNTGVFTQQSDLGGAATDVDIAGVAYTNNAAGASQTTLYGVETNQPIAGNSRLVVIDPPAAGSLTTVDSNANGLGLAVDSQETGFDVSSENRAFATLSVGGVFGMYRINLRVADGGNGTGDATLIGVLGSAAAQSAITGFKARGFALTLPSPPSPSSPSSPPATVADTLAPTLSGLALSRKRFRVGREPTPLTARRRARAKAGTTISYRVSESGTVTFTIERVLPGRRKRVRGKRRCVKPTRKLIRAKARRCRRYRRAGRLTRQANSGANKLAFSGRIGSRALRPGKYRLTLRATDAAGNRSPARRSNFTIVRR